LRPAALISGALSKLGGADAAANPAHADRPKAFQVNTSAALRRFQARLALAREAVPPPQRRYFSAAAWAYPQALLWHGLFIFIFWAVAAVPLALLNIGSAAVWVVVLWLHFTGRLRLAAVFAALEIVAHAVVCVYALGWAAGFQFYLVALSAAVFITPLGGAGTRASLALALALLFAGLHFVFDGVPPRIPLSPTVLDWMFYGNAISMFLVLAIIVFFYDDAALRAEAALIAEKEKSEDMATLLRRMFGRYLAPEVMESLLENPSALELGGETRRVTIMMTDLRGFTALAERLSPEQVVRMLNVYFEAMVGVIERYHGTVNEIVGDALLVLFGAPQDLPDRTATAVACAIEMQNAMAAVNERNRAEGLPELQMGIGLNDTEVIVGNIGSTRRSKYAAVGSGVNMTSRIESYSVGGQILVSESVRDALGERLRIDGQRNVLPKGAEMPLRIYEVGGIGGRFNLALTREADEPVLLAAPVPLRCVALEGKGGGGDALAGRMLRLARSCAEIDAAVPLAPMTDLRMQLAEVSEALAAREFYGKVVRAGADGALVRFTAVPPEIDAYFEALRQHGRRES
jgi:class 3 adenylate cyclase